MGTKESEGREGLPAAAPGVERLAASDLGPAFTFNSMIDVLVVNVIG